MPRRPTNDPLTRAERSRHMAGIRSRDTKPELIVRGLLRSLGIKFRSDQSSRDRLPGRPDFVLAQRKVALFVHGCFWHRHAGCAANRTPKTNVRFWIDKFRANVARDRRAARALRARGWRVVIAWECRLHTPEAFRRRLLRALKVRVTRPDAPRPRR